MQHSPPWAKGCLDLAAAAFGLRQEIYEYGHGGDSNRDHTNLLRSVDEEVMKGRSESCCGFGARRHGVTELSSQSNSSKEASGAA
jgi:hypothetical protein